MKQGGDTTCEAERPVPVNEEHFPDPVFRGIVERCWADRGMLHGDAAREVREIELLAEIAEVMDFRPGDTVDMPKDLTGIGHFPNLEVLDVTGCGATVLDVSANTEIRRLYCSDSDIERIVVGENAQLRELDCELCSISELDLSGCPGLRVLRCGGNPLTRIDVSACRSLEVLDLTNPRHGSKEVRPLERTYVPLWIHSRDEAEKTSSQSPSTTARRGSST